MRTRVGLTSAGRRPLMTSGARARISAHSEAVTPPRRPGTSRCMLLDLGTSGERVVTSDSPLRAPACCQKVPRPLSTAGVGHAEGMSLAWDSQKVRTTSTPRPAASATASRGIRDLPMPGGPTTFTTPPRPSIARSTMASTAAISERRPTRLASVRPPRPSRGRSQPVDPAAAATRAAAMDFDAGGIEL